MDAFIDWANSLSQADKEQLLEDMWLDNEHWISAGSPPAKKKK